MPDIWTKHPEIVRSLLQEGGFTCGVAPRILKGRDPTWTCIVDGRTLRGDLYIHHVDELLKAQMQMSLASWLGVLLGLGFLVSRWRQWRAVSSEQGATGAP